VKVLSYDDVRNHRDESRAIDDLKTSAAKRQCGSMRVDS
jgi:hypothetical protein